MLLEGIGFAVGLFEEPKGIHDYKFIIVLVKF